MKILLVGNDRYLWQKIRLLCPHDEVAHSSAALGDFDRLIWDSETALGTAPTGAITIGTGAADTLHPTFCERELFLALGKERGAKVSVDELSRTVLIGARRIKLTEVELALFSALYQNIGKFVSRKELILRVWGGSGNDSLINVYVHYLRTKLEHGGRRLIFSSRTEGYKLDCSAEE